MEQTGKQNIVHITQSTYNLIKGKTAFRFATAASVSHLGDEISTYDLSYSLSRKQSFHTIEELRGFYLGDGINANVNINREDSLNIDGNPGGSSDILKKIGRTMEAFNSQMGRISNRFLDKDLEEDFEFDFITHQYSAQTLSSAITVFLFLAVAVFQNLDQSALIPIFWVHCIFGIALVSLTLAIRRLQSKCHSFFVEFKKQNNDSHSQMIKKEFKASMNSVNVLSPETDDREVYSKIFKWVKPNASAISSIWIAHAAVILASLLITHQASRILPLIAMVSLHFGFFGTHSLYLNGSLIVYMLFCAGIFIPALLANELIFDALQMMGYNITIFVLIGFIIFENNYRIDRMLRLNYYLEDESEVALAKTLKAQKATEGLLLNILPQTVVEKLKDNPTVQIAASN